VPFLLLQDRRRIADAAPKSGFPLYLNAARLDTEYRRAEHKASNVSLRLPSCFPGQTSEMRLAMIEPLS